METVGVPAGKLCRSSFWEMLMCCTFAVCLVVDRKRLRCGLGIRCVSVRTVIKQYGTQSTKSPWKIPQAFKKGALVDLKAAAVTSTVALCH